MAASNAGGTSANSVEVSATPNYANSSYTSTPPPLDGTNGGSWANAPFIPLDHKNSGATPDTASYKVLWDTTNLYILVAVQDGTPIQSPSVWDGDSAEVYFSGTNSKGSSYGPSDFQYAFPWKGTAVTESHHNATTGVIFSQTNIAGGYQMTIALPWSTLKTSPVANQQLGFDVMINDAIALGTRVGKMAWWATADQTWGNPSLMGPLLLSPATTQPPAATPTFSLAAGTYTSPQSVTLYDTTAGTSIYYTTDGSTPTPASTKYIGAIAISATESIKVIAVANGYSDSAVATATYTINLPAATPAMSPAPGTYTDPQSVTLSSATVGASIRYTTDGSDPTATAGTLYTAPVTIALTTTLKAIAYGTGSSPSLVASAVYTINLPTSAPTFTPAGGTYVTSQSVSISSATAGASIRCTLNGSVPTSTTGMLYTAPVAIAATSTLEAIAFVVNASSSTVVSASYVISKPAGLPTGWTDLDVGNPTMAGSATYKTSIWTMLGGGVDIYGSADQFNLAGESALGDTTILAKVTSITNTDSWAKAGLVLRASSTPGAIYAGIFATPANGVIFQWRSTADGTTTYSQTSGVGSPSLQSPVWLKLVSTGGVSTGYYSLDGKPFTPVGTPVMLQFSTANYIAGLAVTSHNTTTLNTATFSNVFVHSAPSRVATTVFTPPGRSYNAPQTVTVTSATAGAHIRYTLDGTTPSITAGAVYSGPFTVGSSAVVRAIAYFSGEVTSPVAAASYNFQLPTGWLEGAIGLPNTDATASLVNGAWTVAAAGSDISGTSDQFGFPNTQVSGDAPITSLITSFTNTDPWAKGGLMFRESSDPAAANVAILATASNGLILQWRSASNGETSFAQILGVPMPSTAKPLWVRRKRIGSSYIGYYSINGKTYTQVGPPVTLNLSGGPVLVGLAVTSHHPSVMNTVTMQHVVLTSP